MLKDLMQISLGQYKNAVGNARHGSQVQERQLMTCERRSMNDLKHGFDIDKLHEEAASLPGLEKAEQLFVELAKDLKVEYVPHRRNHG